MFDKVIPLSVPNLKGNELKYISDAVRTGWVSTAGSYVNEFEQKIAKYVQTPGAVSCQSGTSGLHIALLVTGVTKDDAVLVPTLTFIAAVNPVRYIGARPIFMDCDESLCMDPVKVEQFCRDECDLVRGKLIERESGRHIKALLTVHVFGNMSDMYQLVEIAKRYNLKIVEDATEALGTYYLDGPYKGKYAGTIGDIGVYSFNGNKIITTGGGGMIVSNDEEYLEHARHLTTQAKSDALYFEHDEVGYNYRMNNLQAAMGLAQLEQLEYFIDVKIKNHDLYKKILGQINGAEFLDFRRGVRSNHWFYALFCKGLQVGRDQLIQYLSENKVQTRPVWGLIHWQIPYMAERAYAVEKAGYYWQHIVNLPCSTDLSKDDIRRVADLIAQANDTAVRDDL